MDKVKDMWYMYGPLFFEWFLASLFFALPMTLILFWFYDVKFVFEIYAMIFLLLSVFSFVFWDMFITHGPR